MNGILIINKHKGCTSHDIVYKVKKMLNEKVGHTGTLDPMATGVLPLLIGKGTLCSKYLINHDKIYQVKLKLGQETDTLDSEGEVLVEKQVSDNSLIKENIEKVLKSFIGKQEQIPPIYSAIKVNGKKLYEYARKGQKVKIEPRKIEIYNMELINVDIISREIEFTVNCSKGTYIRSLCKDIALKLDTVGFMSELNRVQVGKFNISKALRLQELEERLQNLETHLITIEELFENNKSINLEDRKIKHFENGVQLTRQEPDGIYKIYNNSKFIGIGLVKNNLLKRDILI